MRKLLPALVLVAVALAAAVVACSSPCQDLAVRICGCQPLGALQTTCVASVKNQLSNGSQQPTSADQQYCQALLATCPDPNNDPDAGVCHTLASPEGKVACGLAYPDSPDAGAPDGGAAVDGGT